MTTRGLKYNFEPGEYILCFEPDLSKARVLYDAKILDVAFSKDKHGRKKPEYHIHFQGWNSSWDRVVAECFVLKYTERNRALMKRIHEVARRVSRKNKTRMRKIDGILREHFGYKLKFDTDTSDSSVDGDEADGEGGKDDEETDESADSESDDHEIVTEAEDNDEDGSMEESTDEEVIFNGVAEEELESRPCGLELPEKIKLKLEDDCYFISRKNKLVKLPAEPNVVTLLEGYVKNFGVNILCATCEKNKPYLRDSTKTPPEKNIGLCKEVMDGLRVFFDFTLPTILLYKQENAQYTKLSTSQRLLVSPRKEDSQPPPVVMSPRLRSVSKNMHSPSQEGETPAKIPRLSPRDDAKRDYFSDDDSPPRRMTRHQFAEEMRKSKTEVGSSSSATPQKLSDTADFSSGGTQGSGRGGHSSSSQSGAKDTRRESLRSRMRSGSGASQPSGAATSTGAGATSARPKKESQHPSTTLADRITPPPPLIIKPSSLYSGGSSSSQTDTPTSGSMEALFHRREAAVNDIFTWQMLPDEVRTKLPSPPSLLYGGHHLLRLFVKLPELLGTMCIPEIPLSVIVKHLELFLEYLASRSEEIFPESAYVNAGEEGFSNGRQSATKH